ncbi:MAG: LD-carboxypeptidase [Myxococcota bacterium]
MNDWLRPPLLKRDDRIRLIAPSGPFDRALFEAGAELLRTRYRVEFDPSVFDRSGFLAGDDLRRSDELNHALTDSSCRAVIAARGGYGATRILPAIRVDELQSTPRWLIGFSDITALHALAANARVASIHGPMVASLGREPAAFEPLVSLLETGRVTALDALQPLRPGEAQGRLLGGNLAVLTSLLGTPFFPDLTGAILLLEDVGESPYRVDRLLTSLRLAGVFDRIVGLVFGEFVRCRPGPDETTVEVVLERACSSLTIPVATNLPVGHGDRNVPLPLGTEAKLVAGATEATLSFVSTG